MQVRVLVVLAALVLRGTLGLLVVEAVAEAKIITRALLVALVVAVMEEIIIKVVLV
jgi:hypothetical protein